MYDLLAKNKKFVWKEEQDRAFKRLQQALVTAPILAYPTSSGRYILDTDASNFAYGAVLSQLQQDENGVEQERVIAYYSKTLSPAEQRYCARRRELLAIQRSVKHFDVYLRGPEFTIRTDHASLQYIKTLTDVTDQMFRWIMLLEKYSYKIEVRAGVDHANADTLSRIPCSGKICICEKVEEFEKRAKTKVGAVYTYTDLHTLPEVTVCAIKFMPHWTAEQIAQYQAGDHDIKILYKAMKEGKDRPKWNEYSGESPVCKAYFHEWRRLEMWNDVLYRRWENFDGSETRLQLVVPHALQKTICREVHDGRSSCHMGKKKVLRLLTKHFYWYKMDKEIAWWIRTCEVCQKKKRPVREPKAPLTKFVSGFPNEQVAMDVVGPMITSKNGHKYVLCITDHFSKYSRAFPMPDQTAKRIARIFVQEWVYMWGEPMSLHADQGGNFESDLMAHICRHLKVEKTRTPPYHPQGNAQVERYNQTMINIVAKLTKKPEYDDWCEQIPIAVAAYNGTEQATTGFTPNRLMFGRELMHNFDKMLPEAKNKDELEQWDDYVQKMDDMTRRAFQAARETIGRSVFLQKKHFDKTANLIHYTVGDVVMIKDHRLHETGTKKLANRYDGPYYVLDTLSDVNFRVAKSSTDRPRVIHHDRMKKVEQWEKADIDWVFKQSRTLQRLKAQPGEDGKTMAEVLDRLTKLENKGKEAKRTYKKKKEKPKPEEKMIGRKLPRGRPKKKEQSEEKEKNVSIEPRDGLRRSARMRDSIK